MVNVLFLCTGNSCRSILAEAYLNHIGKGRIHACSAGSQPAGGVNPQSLETLRRHGISTDGLRSKSWDELKDTPFDLVVTVCDNAAGEACPLFPGGPVKTHWGVPDPAHFMGDDRQKAAEFERVFALLKAPIDRLAALPPDQLRKHSLSAAVRKIAPPPQDPSAVSQRI